MNPEEGKEGSQEEELCHSVVGNNIDNDNDNDNDDKNENENENTAMLLPPSRSIEGKDLKNLNSSNETTETDDNVVLFVEDTDGESTALIDEINGTSNLRNHDHGQKVDDPMKRQEESSTTSLPNDKNENQNDNDNDNNNDSDKTARNKTIKKVGVAVAGGALITAGIPLIPVLCAGELMIIGGLGLLATEFDSAKLALNKGREKLVEFAENQEDELTQNDKNSSIVVEAKDMNIVNEKSASDSRQDKVKKFGKNIRQSLRNMVKNDVLPMMDKFAPVETDDSDSSTTQTQSVTAT